MAASDNTTKQESNNINHKTQTQPESESNSSPALPVPPLPPPLPAPPMPPALPPAGDGADSKLEPGGAALKMDHLGPVVVNEDGTMSRITNWDKMADIERENTLKILGKRNQLRLAKLRGEQPQQEGDEDKNAESEK